MCSVASFALRLIPLRQAILLDLEFKTFSTRPIDSQLVFVIFLSVPLTALGFQGHTDPRPAPDTGAGRLTWVLLTAVQQALLNY